MRRIINRDLAACEYFIGMMWKRWGSPPDHGGPYSSGFEEEFEETIKRRKQEGRPEISLYFKDVGEELKRDPGEELKKVIAFRDKVTERRVVFYETFADKEDFSSKIRRCITSYLFQLHQNEMRMSLAAKQDSKESDGRDAGAKSANGIISDRAAGFLRKVIEVAEQDSSEELPASDVARFRLRAQLLHRPGNDELVLGTHDANLLFVQRHSIKFENDEIIGLLECGFSNSSHQSAPLWCWLNLWDGFARHLLPLHTLFGSATKRRGALSAMNLVGQTLNSTVDFPRAKFISEWLNNSESEVKSQALKYLSNWGVAVDLPDIHLELKREDYHTRAYAAEAIIRINLRDSRQKALAAVVDIQLDNLKDKLIEDVFGSGSGLDEEVVSLGLRHKSSNVRRRCAQYLGRRNKLSSDVAERLSIDTDALVRLEAINALVGSGKVFSNSDVKSILVKPQPGILYGGTDAEGEALFEEYMIKELSSLSLEGIRKLHLKSFALNDTAFFALLKKDYKKGAAELRTCIHDQFQAHFEAGVDRLSKMIGVENETVTKTRSLSEWVRKKLTRRALDILCKNGDPEDLPLVRKTLTSGFVGYSDADIGYLKKCGEWDDVVVIVETLERDHPASLTLLGRADRGDRYEKAANVIFALSRDRISEAINLISASEQLLNAFLARLTTATFRQLSDLQLLELFDSQSVETRKIAALAALRHLSKARLTSLLATYLSRDEPIFYNVVFWLDLGAFFPSSISRQAAAIALQE